MFNAFLTKAGELCSAEISFALAIVVNYEPPVSGKPGDKAIIQSDGTVWGWIGGGCVNPLIVREALKAIEEGNPRLVRIAPVENLKEEAGTVNYLMTCHGGGSLEVYIEPVMPKKKLLIFGQSPAAQSLSALGKTVGYTVAVVAPQGGRERFPEADFYAEKFSSTAMNITSETYIVVATQGEEDEEALETALRTDARYISFIASRAKAEKVIALLSERGLPWQILSRIKAPAGLDLGASEPGEIAISILAELIQVSKSRVLRTNAKTPVGKSSDLVAIDPVCGMSVDIGGSNLRTEFEGRAFYFCSSGCKQLFAKDPEKYAGSQPE
jgi:xanthine dehydrogenase accessory factor